MRIEGLLLDMDGTLLEIDLGSFLRRYFAALGPVLAEIVGPSGNARLALDAVMQATEAMCAPHDGMTNQQRFNEEFHALTGMRLDEPVAARAIEAFYRDSFPGLRAGEAPRPGGTEVLKAARESGMRVALATNPIFPRAAIVERLRWAGFEPAEFDLITCYENMSACKPAARYFKDTASQLGVDPTKCLMVGDDPVLDMAAGDVGMKTFYVGTTHRPASDWHGRLEDLAQLIERLCA